MAELICGDAVVGYVEFDGGDMFWHFATFQPGPAFEQYVAHFEHYRLLDAEHEALLHAAHDVVDNDARENRSDVLDDELEAALERVNQLGLMIKLGQETYPIRDFKFMFENRVEFKMDIPQRPSWIERLISAFRRPASRAE